MTPAVYQSDNFAGRVNLAASYISKGRNTSRTFDTCFEMGDGDAVATALVRRAKKNPGGKLALNLYRYISKHSATEAAEKLVDIKTRDLKLEAAKQRSN